MLIFVLLFLPLFNFTVLLTTPGLDHMKPLVHEHCKRLLINLVVVLVCRGERSTVAKALLDFQSVSNIALDRSIGVKGSISAIVEEGSVVDSAETGVADPDNIQR